MITDRELTQKERSKLARSNWWTAILFTFLGVAIIVVGIVGLVRAAASPPVAYVQIICGVLFVAGSWKPYRAYLKEKSDS